MSSILQHVRRGRIRGIYSVREDFGEVIEAEALETSALVNRSLKESKLPKGVIVGAIVRDEEVIAPRGETVIGKNDSVILFRHMRLLSRLKKCFLFELISFNFIKTIEERGGDVTSCLCKWTLSQAC